MFGAESPGAKVLGAAHHYISHITKISETNNISPAAQTTKVLGRLRITKVWHDFCIHISEVPPVSFTKKEAQQFRIAYMKAVKEGKEVFEFQGRDFLLSYARYVIEHFKCKGLISNNEDEVLDDIMLMEDLENDDN